MHKFAKVVSIIANVIAVLAILVALLAIWSVITTQKGKAPQVFGVSVLRVVSGSMEPAIPTGAVVFTKAVAVSSLKVGDVIAFYSEDPEIKDKINTHRIVASSRESGQEVFTTKGDANKIEDPYPVPAARIVGKVMAESNALGYVAAALSNLYVFIIIIMLPLVLIILSNLRQIIRLIKKSVAEDNEDGWNEHGK